MAEEPVKNHWYQKAMKGINVKAKDKMQKRIKEAKSASLPKHFKADKDGKKVCV